MEGSTKGEKGRKKEFKKKNNGSNKEKSKQKRERKKGSERLKVGKEESRGVILLR